MPKMLIREECAAFISFSPPHEIAKLSTINDFIEQSPTGYIFVAGLWSNTKNSNGTDDEWKFNQRPNTNVPIIYYRKIHKVHM